MVVSCFVYVGCLDFCNMIERVQHHPILNRIFISNLKDNQVTLAGVTFTLFTSIIAAATGIPNMGERWFKSKDLDVQYYEPFIKPRYINERRVFFLSTTFLMGIPPWWRSSWSTYLVKEGSPYSIHIILDYLCTSQESNCLISHIICSRAWSKWHTLYKGEIMTSRWIAFFTILSSRSLSSINLTSCISHGTPSWPMISSQI